MEFLEHWGDVATSNALIMLIRRLFTQASSGAAPVVLDLSPTQNLTNDQFFAGSDGHGGTNVMMGTGSWIATSPASVAGAYYFMPGGLSNSGDIVGWHIAAGLPAGTANGYINNHGVTTLISLPYGAHFSGINNSDQVVGVYQPAGPVAGNPSSGFIYQNGNFTALNFPGAQETSVSGINDSGEVVGTYLISTGQVGTWTYSVQQGGFTYANGVYTAINAPGSSRTVATGINDNGDVVGYYLSNNQYGFIDHNGVFTSFVAATNEGSIMPLSINDNGDVVGYYNPYNSYGYSMFIYHNGVASASIKGYSSGTFPYPSALSMVINDAGQILINGSLYTYTVTASNTDYSSMNLPGVTGLSVWQGWAKVTNGQFAGLASLSTSTYSSGATIYAATAGTYDLSTKQVTGLFNLSAAQTSAAVTLGANAAGETLTGGAGTTTFSVAFANDTLNGGSGTNIFDYAWQPTSVAGAVINGGTGTNILNTWDGGLWLEHAVERRGSP